MRRHPTAERVCGRTALLWHPATPAAGRRAQPGSPAGWLKRLPLPTPDVCEIVIDQGRPESRGRAGIPASRRHPASRCYFGQILSATAGDVFPIGEARFIIFSL